MQVFAFAQPHKPIQHGAFGEGNCPSYFDFFCKLGDPEPENTILFSPPPSSLIPNFLVTLTKFLKQNCLSFCDLEDSENAIKMDFFHLTTPLLLGTCS